MISKNHGAELVRELHDLGQRHFGENRDQEARPKAEATAVALLERKGPAVTALGRAVLQCYYRDDRVFRSIGREPRPPKDWTPKTPSGGNGGGGAPSVQTDPAPTAA